jgi:hypothetical protein
MSENFKGHDPESGLLQRARTWRDVLPQLVMLNSLRVAGSPLFVGLWLIVATIDFALLSAGQVVLPAQLREGLLGIASGPASKVAEALNDWSPLKMGLLLVAILIALIPMALTMRAGAIYAAGREGESVTAGVKFVAARFLTLLTVFALPIVCSVGLLVPIAANALVERVPGVGTALSELVAVVTVPFAILLGLIAAGTAIAIPLGWAAVAIEKRNDAFDALSRGYEYLYRRPVQCFLGIVLNVLLTSLVSAIAFAVATASSLGCSLVYRLFSGEQQLPVVMQIALGNLPVAVAFAAWFANLGALYLLLRQFANQQEIEDIAVSEVDRRGQGLPKFKPK